MKRVYRLLRNNEESGPYTIDELLGQNLKSSDMLWVEGRSTAWCYLSEIELFPSAEPEVLPKRVEPVKKDDIESRADEIRKKVLSFKPQQLPVRTEKDEKGEKHYFIPITPNDTIEIVDHRKKKSTMPADVLMTLLIIGLFAGGIYGGRALFLPKKQVSSAVVQSVTKDEHAAKTNSLVNNKPVVMVATVDSTALAALKPANNSLPKKPFDSNRSSKRITKISTRNTDTIIANDQTDTQAVVENETESKKNEAEFVKDVKPVSINSDEIAKDDSQDKKSGLFKKIFGKKKKTERDEN